MAIPTTEKASLNSKKSTSFVVKPTFERAFGRAFEGEVVKRSDETNNDKMPTGAVELVITKATVQSVAETLPLQVNADVEFPEETRLSTGS